MKKLARRAAAQTLAAAFLLTAFTGSAHANAQDADAAIAQEWQTAWDTYHFSDTTPPAEGSGRRRVTSSISIEINAPAARVFPAYSDFNHHIGMNPFLRRVITHKDWCSAGTRNINLTAIEEIPYEGTVVVSKTHAQQRLHEKELYYETDSWSFPGVVTHQKIVFNQLKGGKTKVTENLTFEADDDMIDFAATNGVAAHQQLQTALKQAIESGAL
ncbi:SRPBCC family protein [Microtetraspora malaysiensis]|uniref:Polyketide cyclase / dehydrase and lipid transport n=1 Tax=Microtetraspora malaysiensis TaxID=161358 RepID=A0ABW6T1I9_9ACTN